MSSVNSVRTNTINIRARVHSERSQSVKTADYGLPVSTNRDTNPDSSGGGEFDDQRGNSFARYQSPWAPTPIVVRKLTTPAASVASAQLPKSLDTNSNPGSGSASLEQTQSAFQQQFSAVATDKEKFHALMEQAFGSSYDRGAAEKIRQQVLSGDFSWMPSIEVVDQATLADTSGTQGEGVGLGAYRSDTDTIYLSRELLAGNPDKALALLSEEVGHAIDARINSSDSAGDEGELFARSLSGEDLSVDQINAIRAENDSGVIVVDGERVEVEYGFFSSIVKSVKKAVGGVVDGVRNLVGGVVDGVKDAVGGVVTGVKDLVGGYIDIVKTGFKKIMNSKVLGQIMSVAQFIPIPIMQVVARGYNAVKAAYAVYQGIKHGSIAMVASGIAGVAGGVAGVGNALGSTASWVSTASRISATASNVAMAHSIIKEGNLAGAAQLAANYFGGDSNVSTALSFVARADSLVNAVENDDVFGVISTGTGLLQDFTGPQGDAMLSTINEHSSILQQIDTARRTGRYGDALGLLNQAFGGLDLPAGTRETITRIENGIRFAQNVDDLINDNNYAEAANMLLGQVSTQIENPETVARIEALSENLTRVDTAVTAFEEGRYDDVITITGDVLGRPLGDKATQFVRELQERANNIEDLVSAVKAGNVQSTVELLNQTLVGIDLPQQATETLSRVENSVRFAGRVDDLLDTGNYAEAANLLLGAVSSTVEDPKAVENINTLADNFTKVEAAVQAFEGGRFDEVITITSGVLGKPLGDKATQFVMQLQERANNVEALVNAVKDSDVQTSAALLSSLTNGKLDNVAGIFESVDEAVKQVESLRTAIDNEDYEDAAGIAASLSEIVIGSSQSVRNSLETLSDILTDKVDVDGVPGASPGIVPAMASDIGEGDAGVQLANSLQRISNVVEIPATFQDVTMPAFPILLEKAVEPRIPSAEELGEAAKRAQQRLDQGDRAGAYLELYKVSGNEQLLAQAQITTYSGAIGGMALEGNFRAKMANPDHYKVTLDEFSHKIDQAVVTLAKNSVVDSKPELFNTFEIMKVDREVWKSEGVEEYFPGNIQYLGIPGMELIAQTPGSEAAILSQDEMELGRRPSEYANDPRYSIITSVDERFVTVTNNDTNRIEVFFDKQFESDRGSVVDGVAPDLEQLVDRPASERVLAERQVKMDFLQAGTIVPSENLPVFDDNTLKPLENLDRVFEYEGKLYQVDDRKLFERYGIDFSILVSDERTLGVLDRTMEGIDYLTTMRHVGHDLEKMITGTGYITDRGRGIAFEGFKRDGIIAELSSEEADLHRDMLEALDEKGLPSPYQSSDAAHKALYNELMIRNNFMDRFGGHSDGINRYEPDDR